MEKAGPKYINSATRNLSQVSLLYVEDEDYLRERMSRILERRIGTLYQAVNGEEGLRKFHEYNPDIVLTDIRMPIMDGLEMSRKIKTENEIVPIVITTAHNDEEFLLRAIDIGIDKYIKKPVNRNELIKTLSNVARTILQQKEIEAKNRFIRMILDNSPEFIIICDDENITYLNKSFLNYLGCINFEDFQNQSLDIQDFIVQDENNPVESGNFCYTIKENVNQNEDTMTVRMFGAGETSNDARTLLVRLNGMPGHTEILVSLSDITEIDKQTRHYQELSIRDSLTGIYNKHKFDEELKKEVDRAQRYDRSLSLILFDIDFFKKVNDTYGHLVGDVALKEVVNVINANIRKTDLFARYGGEEFVIISPETNSDQAMEIAEKLRKMIEEHDFPKVGRLTCSFGVSELGKEEVGNNLLEHADQAMYRAKKTGRNRVELQ